MPKTLNSLPLLTTHLAATFQCSTCGDCCRSHFTIEVDELTHHQISEALSRRPHPHSLALRPEQAFTLAEAPTKEHHARLNRRPDGACVFLDSDNLCYLHRHFGQVFKPRACQAYPFRPVIRPGAVVAPASLSCSSLRRELTQVCSGDAAATGALGPAPADLRPLVRLTGERFSPGAYLRLGKGRRLRVELLGQVEERMVGLLTEERLTLTQRLLGVRYFAEELVLTGGERLGPSEVDAAWERAVGTDGERLRARAAAAAPSMRNQLGMLFQLLSDIENTGGGGQELAARQAQFFGLGMDLSPGEVEDLPARLYGWRFTLPVTQHGLAPLLGAYFSERLRASELTHRFGLLAMTQGLVLSASLLRFLACGVAGEHMRVVTRDDLGQAIQEVEAIFYHNQALLSFLFEEEGARRSAHYLDLSAAETLLLLPPPPSQFGLDPIRPSGRTGAEMSAG